MGRLSSTPASVIPLICIICKKVRKKAGKCVTEYLSQADTVSLGKQHHLKGLWHGQWSTPFRSCIPHS